MPWSLSRRPTKHVQSSMELNCGTGLREQEKVVTKAQENSYQLWLSAELSHSHSDMPDF